MSSIAKASSIPPVERNRPRAAIVYDFDGTLARGNIQERSFIPSIGLTQEEFWNQAKQMAQEGDADEILCYMQLLVKLAKDRNVPVTADQLREHGKDADLFPGLADGTWFDRTNAFATANGLELKHYVVSSGTFEMIVGCPIYPRFKRVFASKFIYHDGEAVWPGLAINYTTKTQFLFRINKGIENSWDSARLNSYMPDHERPIPFSRMIFVGDGDTDIPSMKMMAHQGGYSVAVCDPKCDIRSIRKIHKLISEDRVSFVAPADYGPDTQMDIIMKGIIGRIARVMSEPSEYRPPLTIA
jgi:phosphoserine phosphatase